jgi:hypothetical protein
MSAFGGPNIQPNGLAFYYDMTNTQKSFIGPPATNLITFSQAYSGGNFMSNWTGNMFNNWINSTVTSGFLAPDGTNTADQLTGYYSRYSQTISVSANTTYTFSCWVKNAGLVNPILLGIATGLNGAVINAPAVTTSAPIDSIGDWSRYSVSYTIPATGVNQIQCGVDFGASRANSATGYSVYAWGAQCEVGSYATPYIPSLGSSGTRSNTQAIRDLTNNNTITATSLTYASDGTFSFNGSNFITIPNTTLGNGTTPWTVSAWVKTTTTTNDLGNGSVMSNSSGGPVYSMMGVNSGRIVYWTYQSSAWAQKLGIRTVNDNNWHMLTWINYDNNTMDMYVDGTLDANVANSTSGNNNPVDRIGGSWSAQFVGSIASVSRYTRALTATEVRQNFNAVRTRYGI